MTRTAEMEPGELSDTEEGLFVYGIVRGDTELPGVMVGLDGRDVVTVRCDRVAALVSPLAVQRPPGRAKELLAYSQALDVVAESHPVVPVRFGAILPDAGSVVEELLAPDEEHFHALLEDLQGRAQFMLRAGYVEEQVLGEIVQSDPEVAELRERTRDLPEEAAYAERVRLGELVARAIEDKRGQDADFLLDRVLTLVDAHVVRPVSGLAPVCDVALLVHSDQRAELEARLESLAEEVHERIRLRLMGPVAPYDFVGEG